MTTELFYLFLTAVLLTILWIPHIVGQARTAGPLTPREYREGRTVPMPPWVRRADRAHVNLVEQFGAFAGLVVVAHLAGVHNAATVWCAAIFFWARVAHAIIHISGFDRFMARTMAFLVAFLALVVYAGAIFANAQWMTAAA